MPLKVCAGARASLRALQYLKTVPSPPMTSYLKRWRTARPRAGAAASEEWEELSALSREDASDREEEDTVVVGAASSAAPPPAKAEASPPESKLEEEEDARPFALLRLRIRPASVAFWVRKPTAVAGSSLGATLASRARSPGAPQRCSWAGTLLSRGSRLYCACRGCARVGSAARAPSPAGAILTVRARRAGGGRRACFW